MSYYRVLLMRTLNEDTMSKRFGAGQLTHRKADLAQRIQDLEDEVEDLYVQYFETPDDGDFANPKGIRSALRHILYRITDMRDGVSQV